MSISKDVLDLFIQAQLEHEVLDAARELVKSQRDMLAVHYYSEKRQKRLTRAVKALGDAVDWLDDGEIS